jgi:serine/threonine protein kinase/dipeptidyl aminopeptidase/acylaminoacyl peptidase
MGEVYRAKDTRLDRTVAIKVLRSHLSDNADTRQRFEREARAVSALNHPHICTLHDIGHQDGMDYLVMEFIEGESLADRLANGALPAEQVFRYAIEIADALDKAHRAGIVHRDLKPGNIMLTKSGAKLLDFGLAKLQSSGPVLVSGLTSLPTELHPLTGEGTILGTFQYMAPEQLEGKEADHRTDLFAFGAVVYEMATGKRAFTGKSQAGLIGAIIKDNPPPISAIQPMVPPALDRVVRKCLAKDPDERWQSAHDLMDELTWIAETESQASKPDAVAVERKNRERVGWLGLTALLLITALILAIAYFQRSPAEVRAVRFLIHPPENSSFVSTGLTAGPVTVSPDGRRLAFVATTAEGRNLLRVRSLDAISPQALTGTEGASWPFWSPDSRFVGFFAQGKLKKIEASGGPALTLCDASEGRGGTWNRDGVIVFARVAGALHRVSDSGGVASAVTKLDEARAENTHRSPCFLPDGQHFLYVGSTRTGETATVYVASLESAESKLLLRANSNVAYAQGYLLFLVERTLMAQPFDAKGLETVGTAFPIAQQIQSDSRRGVFSVSENGVLAYQTGSVVEGSQLTWLDRGGNSLGVLGDLADYRNLHLSPDGKMAAVSIVDPQTGNMDIWLYEIARGLRTRFTSDPAQERVAMWSPDGSRIVFNSDRKGHFDLYQKASSGTGSGELLLESNFAKFPSSFSPHGRFLIYQIAEGDGSNTKSDLWVLPLSGDQKPYPFLGTEFAEAGGEFSPNGRWVAYTSDESRSNEIYVAPFPGPGGKRQISTGGGSQPKWRGDGKEIFYLSPDNKLMAAEVNGEGTSFEVGAVRALFETRAERPGRSVYDVADNGQRFLVNTAVEQKSSSPITVVLNWTADLKQ